MQARLAMGLSTINRGSGKREPKRLWGNTVSSFDLLVFALANGQLQGWTSRRLDLNHSCRAIGTGDRTRGVLVVVAWELAAGEAPRSSIVGSCAVGGRGFLAWVNYQFRP